MSGLKFTEMHFQQENACSVVNNTFTEFINLNGNFNIYTILKSNVFLNIN